MDIKYLGHASFFIKSKDAKIVTDPYDSSIGIKFPKTEADIVTVSHQHSDHNYLKGISGTPLIVDWPGEFEKMGVRVSGFKSFHDEKKGAERGENILFKIETEDISILHCGDLGMIPDDSFFEDIGSIDILMVPVGGFYTVDPAQACAVIKKVDPYMVIPMHYKTPDLDPKIFEKLATVDDFIKKLGATPEKTNKLTVKESDFEGDNMRVVVMEATS